MTEISVPKFATDAAVLEWMRRVGTKSSPREHCEALLRAGAPRLCADALNAAADQIDEYANEEDQEPSHSMALTFAARLVRARAKELLRR